MNPVISINPVSEWQAYDKIDDKKKCRIEH